MKSIKLYIFTIIFWDFRLRPPARRGHRGLRPGGILDWWNRYALSIKMDRIPLITNIPAFHRSIIPKFLMLSKEELSPLTHQYPGRKLR